MKNVFLAFGLAVMPTVAAAQMVVTSPVPGAQPERRSYQLCSSWNYSSDAGGYVCSYTSYEDILDYWDIQQLEQTISQLQNQVRDLESRVARLEARP